MPQRMVIHDVEDYRDEPAAATVRTHQEFSSCVYIETVNMLGGECVRAHAFSLRNRPLSRYRNQWQPIPYMDMIDILSFTGSGGKSECYILQKRHSRPVWSAIEVTDMSFTVSVIPILATVFFGGKEIISKPVF